MTDNPAPVGRTVVTYTVLRIAMAVFVFGVCLIAGLDTPLAIVIAFFVSSIASFVLLRQQRDQLAGGLMARRQAKLDAKDRRREALGD